MADWSVARRLKVGLGTLAGVILMVALVAVGASLFLKGQFGEYRGTSQTTNDINAIAEDLFDARLAAADMQAGRGDAVALRDEVGANVAEIDEVAHRLLDAGEIDAQTRAHLETVLTDAATFHAAFLTAADRQGERDSLLAGALEEGDAAKEALTALMDASNRTGDAGTTFSAARVQRELMEGRMALERFAATSAPEQIETARTVLAGAQQQLSWMATMVSDQTRTEALASARDLVSAYAETAEAIAATQAARDAAYADMHEAEATKMTAIDTLVDDLVARQQSVGAEIRATFAMTSLGLSLLAGVSLLGALLMARAMLRRIGADFDRSLETVGALADGDLDVEIEGAGRATEFGRLADAFVIFRDKGKDAQELALREEAARKERIEAERQQAEREAQAERARTEAEARAAETRKREIFETLRAAVDGVVTAAAAGDFSRRVDAGALDPELEPFARGINRLMENVDRGLAEIAKVSGRLAEGDLRAGMDGQFEGTFAALQQNIEAMIASLGGLLSSIAAEAGGVAGQSAEMTAGAEDLARRAESQAASLEQTSAAMTQIASSAESNAHSAAQTNTAATEMNDEAGKARAVLDGTVAAMRDIEAHSKEIEAIVDVIEDIAFQTNLLSLNASVEAARAGEAGKGFAVVANEVRALAQRSAEASSKVQQIIAQSTGAISRGSSAVDETGEALSRIVERIGTVSANLREIKSASEEQATAVKDISNAFGQLDKITQKNAAVAEQTRGAAALLSTQSERMQQAIGKVRLRNAPRPAGQGARGKTGSEAA